MLITNKWLILIIFHLATVHSRLVERSNTNNNNNNNNNNKCYDEYGKAKRCSPDFVNAAYNRTVISTNTCGSSTSQYCVQTNLQAAAADYGENRFEKCDVCDMNNPLKSHQADYMIDGSGLTWWQSDTLEYDLQYPSSVNITIHLGKTFEITYVQVKFHSSRPESFAIYKRTNETSDWMPYQYYSASCDATYGKNPNEIVYRGNEAIALCSDEFSDIAPLSGGSVAFSTLESRPSAYQFEDSEQLKEWVTASDIKITLNRLNTFGDEVFGDPMVLSSYYYAISDISIGGKCKCNGHAEKCVEFEDHNLDSTLKCQCEHNTDGIDCEKCAPFYNDRPWAAANTTDVNECLPCNCNGFSNECVFNRSLYDQTGHGGVCVNCRNNTDGINCELCKYGFYRKSDDNNCYDCKCDKLGSVSLQCDPDGKCRCKPGVTGDKCDQCMPNYCQLTEAGCRPCECNPSGSVKPPPYCDSRTGKCECKYNVEGHNCDRCKLGFYNLDASLSAGCLACFCFGHTNECKSSNSHVFLELKSDFNEETWASVDLYNHAVNLNYDPNAAGVFIHNTNQDIWFSAPKKYLGNQRNSYNQKLLFRLRFKLGFSSALRRDLILEGNGLQVFRSIYESVVPNYSDQNEEFDKEFSFKLIETDGWQPSLSSRDFHRLLSNLTSIKIKTTFGGYTRLNQFILQSAKKQPKSMFEQDSSLKPLSLIEDCNCPPNYAGQFCENCQFGYTRKTPYGDSFTECVPCSCNNHSVSCNPTSGKCNCIHHTMGENCESCLSGYYGDALKGTPTDCKKCPCPNDGPCVEIYNHQSNSNEVVCLNCPDGTRGNMCDLCEDGYYVSSKSDEKNLVCEKCECNANIDENAIGNCDSASGKCLRCIFNTTGDQCEKCLPHFWGNALSDVKCHACECDKLGSESSECDLNNGQCKCRPNVMGRQCDQCKDTYWNLTSGTGCTECNCDSVGSVSLSCNVQTGQCECQPGVTGVKCDQCLPNYFNLTSEGCKKCECNELGSLSLQCDHLGKCKCKPNIAGDKCDRCVENYFNFTMGCTSCPECYGLVQTKVSQLTRDINDLRSSFENHIPNDSDEVKQKIKDLVEYLLRIKDDVNSLHNKLFDKDVLKPNYKESLKHAEDSLQSISLEFKKLKPSALIEKQIDEMFKLTNVTLANLFKNINLLEESNRLTLEKRRDTLETVKEKYEYLTDSYLQENNPTALKLKNSAVRAREQAQEQQINAEAIQDSLETNLKSIRASLTQLNEIVSNVARLKLNDDISNEQIIKSSQMLLKEANEAKDSLDSKVQRVSNLKVDLDKNLFEESKYQNEIETANNKVTELDTKLKESKSKANSLAQKLDKHLEQSKTKLTEYETNLNQYKIHDDDLSKLYVMSETAKNKTDEAFKLIEETRQNATNMLSFLQDFENKFNTSKDMASRAQALRADTLGNLDQNRKFNLKSKETLEKIKQLSTESKSNLELSKFDIEESHKKTSKVLNASKELNSNVRTVLDDVNSLDKRRIKTLSALSNSIEINDQIGKRLDDIQANTDKVIDQSQLLLGNIVNSEYDLLQVEQISSSLIGIGIEDIKRMERNYDEVFKDVDLFVRINRQLNDLYEASERNQQKLSEFEREIPLLKSQIKELNLIESNLKPRCNFYSKKKTNINREY